MTPSNKHRILGALPFVSASLALFVASSIPTLRPPDLGFEWQDKLFHALAYIVYAACVHLFAVCTLHIRSQLAVGGTVLAIGLGFAATDEWHQTFVQGRVGDVADWLADSMGVIVWIVAHGVFTRRRM